VAEDTEMVGRLLDLEEAADGRAGVRGWVRHFSATGHAVYVAAYARHQTDGIAYLNIAFPLPFANLTSILRLDSLPEGGVRLTSLPSPDRAGDEGVYFVLRRLKLRLPLQETIAVRPLNNSPAGSNSVDVSAGGPACSARHDMWFMGCLYLRLEYLLHRRL